MAAHFVVDGFAPVVGKKNEEQNARPGAIRRLQRDEKKKKGREKKGEMAIGGMSMAGK